MFKSLLLGLFLLLTCSVSQLTINAQYADSTSELAQSYITALKAKGVPLHNLATAEINPLERTPTDFDTTNDDFFYWLDFLPEQHQAHTEYLLLRRFGIMLPLINISEADRSLITQGKSISHHQYLERGVVHHFGTKPQDGFGNFSIAGHSSYGKDKGGDFKTAFLPLLLMEADDQIDYYIRSDDYVQVFTYRVAHTDIVAPEDTYILEQPKEHEYQLTAYACYPAGSNKQRKYVRAILEDSSLQDILTPTQELHAAAPVSTGTDEITIEEPTASTGSQAITSAQATNNTALNQETFFIALRSYIDTLEVTEVDTKKYIGGKDMDRWKETIVTLYKKFVVE